MAVPVKLVRRPTAPRRRGAVEPVADVPAQRGAAARPGLADVVDGADRGGGDSLLSPVGIAGLVVAVTAGVELLRGAAPGRRCRPGAGAGPGRRRCPDAARRWRTRTPSCLGLRSDPGRSSGSRTSSTGPGPANARHSSVAATPPAHRCRVLRAPPRRGMTSGHKDREEGRSAPVGAGRLAGRRRRLPAAARGRLARPDRRPAGRAPVGAGAVTTSTFDRIVVGFGELGQRLPGRHHAALTDLRRRRLRRALRVLRGGQDRRRASTTACPGSYRRYNARAVRHRPRRPRRPHARSRTPGRCVAELQEVHPLVRSSTPSCPEAQHSFDVLSSHPVRPRGGPSSRFTSAR